MPGSICNGSTGTLWRVRKLRGEESTLLVLSLSQFKTATLCVSLTLPSQSRLFLSACLLLGCTNTLLLLPTSLPDRLIADARPWYPSNTAATQHDIFGHLWLEQDQTKLCHFMEEPGSFDGGFNLRVSGIFVFFLISLCAPQKLWTRQTINAWISDT